jgi:hypothetical protein
MKKGFGMAITVKLICPFAMLHSIVPDCCMCPPGTNVVHGIEAVLLKWQLLGCFSLSY